MSEATEKKAGGAERIESIWTPRNTAERLYEERFKKLSAGCGFRDLCFTNSIRCHLATCPIQHHLNSR